MEAVHDLLDGGGVIPPVDVQDVDVVSAELLQGRLDRHDHGLGTVSGIVNFLTEGFRLSTLVVGGVL